MQLRTKEFKDFSHQEKLETATCSTKMILEKAKKLLNDMFKEGMYIRLIGVIEKDDMQMSLFNYIKNEEKQNRLDKVVDLLKDKYGTNSIVRAGKMNIDKKIKMQK